MYSAELTTAYFITKALNTHLSSPILKIKIFIKNLQIYFDRPFDETHALNKKKGFLSGQSTKALSLRPSA